MKTVINRLLSAMLCICLLAATIITSFAATVSYNGSPAYMSSIYYERLSKIQLTGDERTDLINIALSQIGYHEGASDNDLDGLNDSKFNNYCEYNYKHYGGKHNGGDSYAWCATFVSWCKNLATNSSRLSDSDKSNDLLFPDFEGCSFASNNFKSGDWQKYGTYHAGPKADPNSSYVPVAGDIVFYKWDSNSWHTGIIVKNSSSENKIITTVEGNTSDDNGNKDCAVSKKTRNTNEVMGYFTPNYITKKYSNLGTIKITQPQNTNNAWVCGDDLIKWDAHPSTAYTEYTIREERRLPSGEYTTIDNWLCKNFKTTSTQIDLSKYNMPKASAWKVWIGSFNANGDLLAQNFVYLRIIAETGNHTEIEDTIPDNNTLNTSGEGYVSDPLPGAGSQTETGNGSSSSSEPTGTEFEDWDIIDDRNNNSDNNLYPSQGPENQNDNIDESIENKIISLLKNIINLLELLLSLFGITF